MNPTTQHPSHVTLVTQSTLLRLTPTHKLIRAAAHDIDRLHKLVMSTHRGHLIEGTDNPRQRLNILYAAQRDLRADGTPGPLTGLLVQSQTPMNHTELCTTGAATLVHVRTQERTFTTGHTIQIRTWANPTRRLPTNRDTPGRGKRLPITRDDLAAQWMIRTMSNKGLEIHCHTLEVGPQLRLKGAQRRTIVLRPYRFQGVITHADAFTAAVRDGIGHAKAYGAGLLHTTHSTPPAQHLTSW
jgi:CRISPR system Cascade subunit CasE